MSLYNYKNSDVLVFGQHKISISLKGFNVAIDLGEDIAIDQDVKVVLDLLSIDELKRVHMLSDKSLEDISVQICEDKIVEVISQYGNKISFDYSGAGVALFIVKGLCVHTQQTLANMLEIYTAYAENILVIEQMGAIVAKNLHIPYTEVIQYPVTEILRLHAICAASFAEVVDLRPKEDDDIVAK